jgi:hypothetical protein
VGSLNKLDDLDLLGSGVSHIRRPIRDRAFFEQPQFHTDAITDDLRSTLPRQGPEVSRLRQL